MALVIGDGQVGFTIPVEVAGSDSLRLSAGSVGHARPKGAVTITQENDGAAGRNGDIGFPVAVEVTHCNCVWLVYERQCTCIQETVTR